MPHIAYNTCHGGFSVSRACWKRICEIKGVPFEPNKDWSTNAPCEEGSMFDSYGRDVSRTDPALIQAVQEMGVLCNTKFSSIRLHEIEAGGRYIIDEYDGLEGITRPDDIEWLTA